MAEIKQHQCAVERKMHLGLNDYPIRDPDRHGWVGDAIDCVIQDAQGRWWATNAEYFTQVNYCPFCGDAAPTTTRPTPAERVVALEEVEEVAIGAWQGQS